MRNAMRQCAVNEFRKWPREAREDAQVTGWEKKAKWGSQAFQARKPEAQQRSKPGRPLTDLVPHNGKQGSCRRCGRGAVERSPRRVILMSRRVGEMIRPVHASTVRTP